MARAHPTSSTPESNTGGMSSIASSPALLHAAWITAAVAVCLALCTIHSRKLSSVLSSRRRGASSSSSRSCASSRESSAAAAGVATATATQAAKVSPTPSETPKANGGAGPGTPRAAATAARGTDVDDSNGAGSGGLVTVIDVGTHGPIAPVFPAPDPIPPRRSLSLSAKHIRFAERFGSLGRIRSMRRGPGEAAAEDDVFVVGARIRGGGGAADEDDYRTLWTKTIILGERCRVPAGRGEVGDGDDDDVMVPWKSYRPRQPRSVPVTRSNSFAGVGACRRAADARY